MSLLGLGGLPLGFAGLQAGFALNDAQDARDARVRNLLAADVEQNVRADLMFNRGLDSGQAQAFQGLNSPFRNSANSQLQSAVGIQRATAPSALAQANTGNFDPINRLLGYFGDVGNVNQSNYNSVDLLGLLGGQGIAAGESLRRTDPLDDLQRRAYELQIQRQQQLIERDRAGGNGGRNAGDPYNFSYDFSSPSFGVVNI